MELKAQAPEWLYLFTANYCKGIKERQYVSVERETCITRKRWLDQGPSETDESGCHWGKERSGGGTGGQAKRPTCKKSQRRPWSETVEALKCTWKRKEKWQTETVEGPQKVHSRLRRICSLPQWGQHCATSMYHKYAVLASTKLRRSADRQQRGWKMAACLLHNLWIFTSMKTTPSRQCYFFSRFPFAFFLPLLFVPPFFR